MDKQLYVPIMARGFEEAQKSVAAGNGGPFGAVVFATKSLEIIASAANMVLVSNDPTAHAEVSVIRLACKALGRPHLQGYSLYATGQPCPMCLAAIHWARLDAYSYTTTYADASQIGFDDAPIRDSMAEITPPMVSGAHWEYLPMREFFLGYGGQRY